MSLTFQESIFSLQNFLITLFKVQTFWHLHPLFSLLAWWMQSHFRPCFSLSLSFSILRPKTQKWHNSKFSFYRVFRRALKSQSNSARGQDIGPNLGHQMCKPFHPPPLLPVQPPSMRVIKYTNHIPFHPFFLFNRHPWRLSNAQTISPFHPFSLFNRHLWGSPFPLSQSFQSPMPNTK